MKEIKNLGIVGAGLLGASIGRFYSDKTNVICFGRNANHLRQAKKLAACRSFSTDYRAIKNCDFVVLATPVDVIIKLAGKIVPLMKKDAILTDVGSVKGEICRKIHPLCARYGIKFVGSHPMAGSEKSGCRWSRADLFKKTTVLITPLAGTDKNAVEKVKKFWRRLKANCVLVSPEKHDEFVAITSHLPHIISFSFAGQFLKFASKNRNIDKFTAGSFADLTRTAKSNPYLWSAIFRQNKKNIQKHLQAFLKAVSVLGRNINSKKLEKILKNIKVSYEKFENQKSKSRFRQD
ncbi:MAG: prephenate dehydrogenase [Elusimicrobia bacterium]|nr:prephenate dehydrogenase [Elusimicrobiota bacterium]